MQSFSNFSHRVPPPTPSSTPYPGFVRSRETKGCPNTHFDQRSGLYTPPNGEFSGPRLTRRGMVISHNAVRSPAPRLRERLQNVIYYGKNKDFKCRTVLFYVELIYALIRFVIRKFLKEIAVCRRQRHIDRSNFLFANV